MTALMVGVVLDRGREQRVDEGRLAQSRLSSNLFIIHSQLFYPDLSFTHSSYHNSEGCASLGNNLVSNKCLLLDSGRSFEKG